MGDHRAGNRSREGKQEGKNRKRKGKSEDGVGFSGITLQRPVQI
jgi:hypothetical protein